jgi:hypothetical protein
MELSVQDSRLKPRMHANGCARLRPFGNSFARRFKPPADYAGHAHELARRYIAAGSAPACHFPIAFTPGNSGWSQ